MEEQYKELLRLIALKHKYGRELNQLNYADNLEYDTPGYKESREAGERRGELHTILRGIKDEMDTIAPNAWFQSRQFERMIKRSQK